MTRIARSRTAAAFAAIALAGAALAAATPAAAHSFIVSSSPEEGSTISEVPEKFSVTANELLLDLTGDASGFAIQVVDASGLYYGDGCTAVSGSTLSMGATLGDPGDYRVYWQVISGDGHVVSGEFAFVWAPAAGVVATPGLGAPPVCGESAVTEPTPTSTPEPEETSEPEPSASATPVAAVDDESAASVNPLLVGGGILGVLAIIVVIVVVARRRSLAGPTDAEATPSPDGDETTAE